MIKKLLKKIKKLKSGFVEWDYSNIFSNTFSRKRNSIHE